MPQSDFFKNFWKPKSPVRGDWLPINVRTNANTWDKINTFAGVIIQDRGALRPAVTGTNKSLTIAPTYTYGGTDYAGGTVASSGEAAITAGASWIKTAGYTSTLTNSGVGAIATMRGISYGSNLVLSSTGASSLVALGAYAYGQTTTSTAGAVSSLIAGYNYDGDISISGGLAQVCAIDVSAYAEFTLTGANGGSGGQVHAVSMAGANTVVQPESRGAMTAIRAVGGADFYAFGQGNAAVVYADGANINQGTSLANYARGSLVAGSFTCSDVGSVIAQTHGAGNLMVTQLDADAGGDIIGLLGSSVTPAKGSAMVGYAHAAASRYHQIRNLAQGCMMVFYADSPASNPKNFRAEMGLTAKGSLMTICGITRNIDSTAYVDGKGCGMFGYVRRGSAQINNSCQGSLAVGKAGVNTSTGYFQVLSSSGSLLVGMASHGQSVLVQNSDGGMAVGRAINAGVIANGGVSSMQLGEGTNDMPKSIGMGAELRFNFYGVPGTVRSGDHWMTGGTQLHRRVRTLAQSAGNFSADEDAQTTQNVLRASTSDTTETELFFTGSSGRLAIAAGEVWAYDVTVVGKSDTSDNIAYFRFEGALQNVAGTLNFVTGGSGVADKTLRDAAGYLCRVDANSTNDALQIWVTGIGTEAIEWLAFVRLTEINT